MIGRDGQYEDVSYWLESCGPITPRAALDGSATADVAILGGGFTGLWTAYQLLKRDPSLRVAVVEQEVCGYGASGRNGGWCTADLNVGPARLQRRFGRDAMQRLQRAMFQAVDGVGEAAREEGIDCDYDKAGLMYVARGANQLAALESTFEEYREAGFEDRWRRLSGEEVSEFARIAGAEAGLYGLDCAAIHPGKLVRGLAEVVERLGGTIYEGTRVTAVESGKQRRFRTDHGYVSAGALVLAGEAYLTRLPGMRRRLLPLYSLIVLTEPLSPERLAEIGWSRRVCMASMRVTVDYLSRTRDGRVLFGGRGAPYNFGSAIKETTERHAGTHESLRSHLVDWFPQLADVHFTHAWGGVLGMPRDWIPEVTFDRAEGVATACGYTGHGVSTTHLAGATLADLVLERDSDLTRLPLVGHRPRRWVVEPFRWLGVRYVQHGVKRYDDRGAARGRRPRFSLAERLARH